MNNWISVEDELPDDKWHKTLRDFSKLKIVANSCAVDTAFYNRIEGAWYCDYPAKSKEWVAKVTHWMDLPENPNLK